MSKVLQSLFIIAAIALALVGSPDSSEARGIAARSGSPSFHSDVDCFAPNGPTMTNSNCNTARFWYVPLVLDGTTFGWVNATVTVEGNVACRLMASDKQGTSFTSEGSFLVQRPEFAPPVDVTLSVWVPGGGTAMFDCLVRPNGKVHTVNW